MKHWMTILLLACFLLTARPALAAVAGEFEKARLAYLNALVSLAAYSDRTGQIARQALADAGWYMKPYNERFQDVEARFFLMENDEIRPGKETYILAVTGTENRNDFKIDLRFEKVFFGGNTPEEFLAAAERKNLTSADPMVHKGFNRYAQAVFFQREEDDRTFGEYLVALLREKRDRKLYIVGHSLGGAVATIGAARLIELGADPTQIAVMTFGAPAVGNETFGDTYGRDLNLTRIVIKGDPVKGVLQAISGGYAQFGNQVVWRGGPAADDKRPHAMVVYVDAALRNYYDTREKLIEAGRGGDYDLARKEGAPMVYAAPIRVNLPKDLSGTEAYLRESVRDELRHTLAGFVLAEGERGSLEDELKKAKAAGCDWLLFSAVDASKVQRQRGDYYMEYHEALYEVRTGALVMLADYGAGTREFTPLGANLHNITSARQTRANALQKSSETVDMHLLAS